VEGVDGVDGCRDGEDGWQGGVEDWVLQGECGFYSSLPEAGEEHEEETKLNQEEGGPDSGLGEHVDGDSGGEHHSGCSDDGEEEEDGPCLGEVGAEGSPGGDESAADSAVGFGVANEGVAEMKAQLDGVDLDEIEVEAKDGGDEEEDDVAGEGEDEGVAADPLLVYVICPFGLKKGEWAEDEAADDGCNEGDADEAPEVEQALMKEDADACRCAGEVDEEGSGDE
jgi:hypothetical protein